MKYPFSVVRTKCDGHVFWVAKSTALKGCVGQGDTLDDAVNELASNEEVWLETAKDFGIDIPAIPIETVQEHSGKLTLRISPTEHEKAVRYAQKEGISLNQYINDAVVARNAEMATAGYIAPRIRTLGDQLERIISKSSSQSSESSTMITGFVKQFPLKYASYSH